MSSFWCRPPYIMFKKFNVVCKFSSLPGVADLSTLILRLKRVARGAFTKYNTCNRLRMATSFPGFMKVTGKGLEVLGCPRLLALMHAARLRACKPCESVTRYLGTRRGCLLLYLGTALRGLYEIVPFSENSTSLKLRFLDLSRERLTTGDEHKVLKCLRQVNGLQHVETCRPPKMAKDIVLKQSKQPEKMCKVLL